MRELRTDGVSFGDATELTSRVFEYKAALAREQGLKTMGCGLLMAIVGGAITGITYAAASEGGYYFVMTGLIFFGAIYFLKGLYHFLAGR